VDQSWSIHLIWWLEVEWNGSKTFHYQVCIISLTINVQEYESPILIKFNVYLVKEKGVIKFKVENTFKIYCFSFYEYGEEY
jgi:hypothetical protein